MQVLLKGSELYYWVFKKYICIFPILLPIYLTANDRRVLED